ncbi:hypothetical protein Pmani_021436 [Petrolisthes manimaculis]|uniref:Uncharacterized protein n=1 Tax=Petrolisthes manimaculis TaxID=1843537 RepID=A0AAE1PDW5_9EUCA|nr:hypothetical protein Pmani_021436 [Petrolisthes manimaculis]
MGVRTGMWTGVRQECENRGVNRSVKTEVWQCVYESERKVLAKLHHYGGDERPGYTTAGPTLITCNNSIINSPPCNSKADLKTAVRRKFPGKGWVGFAKYVGNAKISRVEAIIFLDPGSSKLQVKSYSQGERVQHQLNTLVTQENSTRESNLRPPVVRL